jgi:hypothetical protein
MSDADQEAEDGKRKAEDPVGLPQSSNSNLQHSALSTQQSDDRLWIPDNPDGSGWADVDWVSAVRGSRYHYRHSEPSAEARAKLPPFYRVVTRLDTPRLHAPHENGYYVPSDRLADFLAELILAGGDEAIWHIEPCEEPPAESRVH